MADYFILPESTASDGISTTPDDFDNEIDRLDLDLDVLDGAAFERIVRTAMALPGSCVDEQHRSASLLL